MLIFMLAPGLLGMQIDRWLGTSLFTPAGFLLGTFLATVALLVLARKLMPPARGKPIPFEDEDEVDGEDDESPSPRAR